MPKTSKCSHFHHYLCKTCNTIKPKKEFYHHHRNICKECKIKKQSIINSQKSKTQLGWKVKIQYLNRFINSAQLLTEKNTKVKSADLEFIWKKFWSKYPVQITKIIDQEFMCNIKLRKTQKSENFEKKNLLFLPYNIEKKITPWNLIPTNHRNAKRYKILKPETFINQLSTETKNFILQILDEIELEYNHSKTKCIGTSISDKSVKMTF